MGNVRLDLLLLERGLVESRAKAQALIMAGQVRVAGQVVLKSSTRVESTAPLELESGPRFVSRGGEKLEAALTGFAVQVKGRICADVGASTGGFTDCLLQYGAAQVYAIDVGKGLLHWKLRNDPRVVVMEETNARFVESLPRSLDLITIDASFISLKLLLPVVMKWLSPLAPTPLPAGNGSIIALIKPQFEAGKREVARGQGVIRDSQIHAQVLLDILNFAQSLGLGVHGIMRSPILGPKGNVEFLARLSQGFKIEGFNSLIEKVI